MTKKKILYIAQEIFPYLEESEVGKDAQLLPLGFLGRGHDIRTFMPNYGVINERRHQLHEVIRLSGSNLTIDNKVHQIIVKVASLQPQRLQVYFIENDDFFKRKGVYTDENDTLYEDNVERAIFFVKGVFETIKKLRWIPDVIHCQGWFAGLAPLYLRTMFKNDPALSKAKIVFSIYNTTPEIPFGSQLTDVLAFDGITHPLLTGKALDKETLYKIILKYIDGMIISTQEISGELLEMIHTSGIAYLNYHKADEIEDAVAHLYEEIIGEEEH